MDSNLIKQVQSTSQEIANTIKKMAKAMERIQNDLRETFNDPTVKGNLRRAGNNLKMYKDVLQENKGYFSNETGILINDEHYKRWFWRKYGSMSIPEFANLPSDQFVYDLAEYAEMRQEENKKAIMAHRNKIFTDINPIDLIKPEKHSILYIYEANIKDLILQWEKGNNKEQCALFCSYLYDNDFFNNNTLPTANIFALARYKCQLKTDSIKNVRKNTTKRMMDKKDNLERMLLGKIYGKLPPRGTP